jgi:hypothetical protein
MVADAIKLPGMDEDTATKPHADQGRPMLRALINGVIVAVPAGWLYSYLAFLPAFIGLFFLFILGLLIGAIMYRSARRFKQQPSLAKLLVVGLLITVIMIGTGLVGEYLQLAPTVSKRLLDHLPRVLLPEEQQQLKQETEACIDSYLHKNYPPGGFIGYLQWAAKDGVLECPRVVMDSTLTYRLSQRRTIWIIRVILSFVLLASAILSQFLALRQQEQSGEATSQATENEGSKSEKSGTEG